MIECIPLLDLVRYHPQGQRAQRENGAFSRAKHIKGLGCGRYCSIKLSCISSVWSNAILDSLFCFHRLLLSWPCVITGLFINMHVTTNTHEDTSLQCSSELRVDCCCMFAGLHAFLIWRVWSSSPFKMGQPCFLLTTIPPGKRIARWPPWWYFVLTSV